tara:strand:+ start:199 stop:870 length:672 start_codon:yes stop_codon:yes gene_type:complete
MKINDFFQEAYCINLDRRKDRWEFSCVQFEKNNIEVKRFPAVDGLKLQKEIPESPSKLDDVYIKFIEKWSPMTWGAVALNLTRRILLQKAKEKKIESIIIFEDDVLFVDNFESKFFNLSYKVPEDWDMLYLGGWNQKGLGDKVCDGLYRCKWTLCAHAVGIHSRMYDKILKAKDNNIFCMKGDAFLADMHSKCNAYVFSPLLATQCEGYSDIEYENRTQDYIS